MEGLVWIVDREKNERSHLSLPFSDLMGRSHVQVYCKMGLLVAMLVRQVHASPSGC